MKTLVIHPKDKTTDFLSVVYEDIKDCEVLRSNPQCVGIRKAIKKADRIIMLGHGTEYGLLGFGRYIINSDLVQLLKDKECVFIWCNANEFTSKYKLSGFATGMIISELQEAIDFCIKTSHDEVEQSNKTFAYAVKLALNNLNKESIILENYKGESSLYQFNIENIKQI
jgi:hypothetical protein